MVALVTALFVLFPTIALGQETDCQTCHGQPGFNTVINDVKIDLYVNPDTYGLGVHKDQACQKCHQGFDDVPHQAGLVSTFKADAQGSCKNCHDKAYWQYANGPHGKAAAEKRPKAPTCAGCHDTHYGLKTSVVDSDTSHANVAQKVCEHCHEEPYETYLEGYHGKTLVVLGYQKSASCTQCHGAHTANPLKDEEQAVRACEKCHPGANANMVGYGVHADENDMSKEPLLFWVKWIMAGLLVGVFAVFYTHSALWAYRDIVENKKRKKGQGGSSMTNGGAVTLDDVTAQPTAVAAPQEEYRRFNKFHIAMHWLVMISFMFLVFTGMPLRYRNAAWAKAMMSLFGGVGWAGFMHRVMAAVTFFYFLAEAGYGLVYAVIIKRVPFFGPDSMMIRWKDIQDFVAMWKYFFGRGKKPEFDRFSYFEKFDYLAVFWGMVAIGATGLFLAFPAFFAKLLPGKIFNIATIMHSDEAVLAAGFIFVVHWFNTHWRPGKFPMDSVVFTGKVTRHELMEERPLEWKRMQENPDLKRRMRIEE